MNGFHACFAAHKIILHFLTDFHECSMLLALLLDIVLHVVVRKVDRIFFFVIIIIFFR